MAQDWETWQNDPLYHIGNREAGGMGAFKMSTNHHQLLQGMHEHDAQETERQLQ